MPDSRQSLRQASRQHRRILSPAQQRQAAESLCARLACQPFFIRSQRIGFYVANDGELDPALLLGIAQQAGKRCHLPVLHPLKHNRLHFVRYRPGDALACNRFGILEPRLAGRVIAPAWSLDVILLPLVAFDRQGHRLGMGGGFYDRTLAFTRHSPRQSPLLIGLAHSCQEVEAIESKGWDIPLNGIATEKELLATSGGVISSGLKKL